MASMLAQRVSVGGRCAGEGTRVVHEVEIDFGDLQDETLKGLRDHFEQARAGVIRAGMAKTLENLAKMAER